MKSFFIIAVASLILTACNQNDATQVENKIYHESQLTQEERIQFQTIASGAQPISKTPYIIIAENNCYWILGERNKEVTVLKLTSEATHRQICPSNQQVTIDDNTKVFLESQLPESERNQFKGIRKDARRISTIRPIIIDSENCYWALGERNNNVAVVKLTSDTSKKQICIPPLPQKPTITSDDGKIDVSCPVGVVSQRYDACPSGFDGQLITSISSKLVDGQCQSFTTTDSSSCKLIKKMK